MVPSSGWPVSDLAGHPAHRGTILSLTYITPLSGTTTGLTAGDLSGDALCVASSWIPTEYSATVLLQDASHPGSFLGSKNVFNTYNSVGTTQSIAQIADMNHDGLPDLVLFPWQGSAFTVSGVSILPGDPQNPGSW